MEESTTYGSQDDEECELPWDVGSETSFQAALMAQEFADKDSVAVAYVIFRAGKHGATDEEIETALRRKHQTVSARRNELAKTPLIQAESRRKTRSNANADVWVWVGGDFSGNKVLSEVRISRSEHASKRKSRPAKREVCVAVDNLRALHRAHTSEFSPELLKITNWLKSLI